MSVATTSLLLGICAAALTVCVILDRRPYKLGKLNYIPMMLGLTIAVMVLGRYLLTLTTGM